MNKAKCNAVQYSAMQCANFMLISSFMLRQCSFTSKIQIEQETRQTDKIMQNIEEEEEEIK